MDITTKQWYKELIEQGFYWYREYFKFGHVQAFRNQDKTEYRFFDPQIGKVLTANEMFNELIKNWRPAAHDEQNHYCDIKDAGIEGWLKV